MRKPGLVKEFVLGHTAREWQRSDEISLLFGFEVLTFDHMRERGAAEY